MPVKIPRGLSYSKWKSKSSVFENLHSYLNWGRPAIHHAPRSCPVFASRIQESCYCTATVPGSPGESKWITKYPSLRDHTLRPNVYILDDSLAGLIVEKLSDENGSLSSEEAVWLEINPGPGVLTRALLEAGLPKIVAMEGSKEFRPEYAAIKKDFPGKFTYVRRNFYKYPYIGDKYFELLKHLNPNSKAETKGTSFTPNSFTEASPLKIVGHIGNWLTEKKFSSTLQHSLIHHKDSLYSQGRVQYISLISSVEHELLTTSFPCQMRKLFRPKSVLQHLLFDTESLLKVPIENLYPPPIMKAYKTKSMMEKGKEPFVLVRMTPKWNLFEEVLQAEHLPLFQFYIKEMLAKKSIRVIPKLETWFPNHGLELIKADFTMTDTIGDMLPEQLLKIFKTILTWPELKDSSLYSGFLRQSTTHDEGEKEESEEKEG